MTEKRICQKYRLSVEGETEKWYFDWLCDMIKKLKGLVWEGDGFLLLAKRLEANGRFQWPRKAEEAK